MKNKSFLILLPSELKKGMIIINIGIVKKITVYENTVEVNIVSGLIQNELKQVCFSPHSTIHVNALDAEPIINNRYF